MASDEGFREIQLNGKQLVFLFMATTIVAVVIFLCGVMVGRGVRNNVTPVAANTVATAPPTGDVGVVPDVQAGARSTTPPMAAAPPPPVEELGGAPPAEKTAAPPAETPTPAPAAPVQKPPAAPAGPVPAAVPASALPSEPAGNGFAVQVAALNEKGQAEVIARHLLDRGYAAYIVPPQAAGGVFRVRVGKFKERREADAVVRRLKKEEQKEPWIIPPTR